MSKIPIMSTAGAVPVRVEKGQFYMEKVKVSRYISGKRPDYAPESSEEEDDVDITGLIKWKNEDVDEMQDNNEKDDRLRRLQQRRQAMDSDDEDIRMRHLQDRNEEIDSDDGRDIGIVHSDSEKEMSEDEDEELDDEEIERRRQALKQKVKDIKKEEEVMDLEEDRLSADEAALSEEESSEDEDVSGSEDDDVGPRLKPVFVRKKDRITIQEKEKAQKERDQEHEKKRLANERRQQTLEIVKAELKREVEAAKPSTDPIDLVNSDDDNDEEEFEEWKAREIKRIKKYRDEKEAIDKEKQEVEKYRNLNEEEKKQELKQNPKFVTNKAAKGKYRFLQKYYHRGVFYLDHEDTIFKRDYSAPTLEDHFNKTVLPKVMQVKNFGRSGRTKYTHLVDQDTTHFDSPWVTENSLAKKFRENCSGGFKQVFERPSAKKRKMAVS